MSFLSQYRDQMELWRPELTLAQLLYSFIRTYIKISAKLNPQCQSLTTLTLLVWFCLVEFTDLGNMIVAQHCHVY